MAAVLWDLITNPLPVSFRMSLMNLIWTKKKKIIANLLHIKKENLKTCLHWAWTLQINLTLSIAPHTPYSELLKTQNIKKENLEENIRRFTWT